MNFMFVIQGEGKGHLSQALVMKKWLEASGHQVSSVYMGRNIPGRRISYAEKELNMALKYFFSPGFIRNPSRRGILPLMSLVLNVFLIPVYVLSVFRLSLAMKDKEIDRILNFYDPVAGFSRLLTGRKKKMFTLGHHFYQGRHVPQSLSTRYVGIFLLRILNFFCSLGSERLALSFSPEKENSSVPGSFYYVPPILESPPEEKSDLQRKIILCYFLNPGFTPNLIHIATRNPHLIFRLYTSSRSTQEAKPANLSISLPSREDFMKDMNRAAAVICTAGFETLCEALYRELPLYVVPSEGHFEQLCNAEEVKLKGFARDISEFSDLLFESADKEEVRAWYHRGKGMILSLLCSS